MLASRMLIGLGLLAGVAACDVTAPDFPATLLGTTGGVQSVALGSQNTMKVTVLDQDEDPMKGVTVNWQLQGSGTITGATSKTDDDGIATMTYTAGAAAGTGTVYASVSSLGSTVTFTFNAK